MDRPIIFSTEMVKAILDGTKTQTRRTYGLERLNACPELWRYLGVDHEGQHKFQYEKTAEIFTVRCPYGQAGDRLWVREAYCHKADPITAVVSYDEFWYRATTPDVMKVDDDGGQAYRKDGCESSPWQSPIRMPRKASRITLEITEVRVERLQEISEGDAVGEGIKPPEHAFRMISGGDIEVNESPQELFAELWDSLNAKRGYGWEINPWVWVISFKQFT